MVFNAPTAIAVNAGRAAFHAATGGVAGVAAGGRRVSRFPDGFPSPSVRRRPARVAVTCDDGTGFAATGGREGNGLRGMRERVSAAGGTLEVSGPGTRLEVTLP